MAISNYNTDWLDLTGLDVQDFIKSKLKESITDLSYDGTNNNLTITKSDGTESTIQIKAESSDTIEATLGTVTRIFKYGEDCTIPFKFKFTHINGTSESIPTNVTTQITAIIILGTKSNSVEVLNGNTTNNSDISITIDGDLLYEGDNKIQLLITTTYLNVDKTETIDCGTFTSLNMILGCNVTIGTDGLTNNYYKIIDKDTEVTYSFTLLNSSGETIKVYNNNKLVSITKTLYYSTDSNILWTGTDDATDVALSTSGAYQDGLQTIYAQASVNIGGNIITSNIIMINLLSITGKSLDGNYILTKAETTNIDYTPIININQYAKFSIPIIVEANDLTNNITYTISKNNVVYQTSTLSASVDTYKNTTISYNFKEVGTYTLSFDNAEGLSIEINVISINASLSTPTGCTLLLSSIGIQQGTESWTNNGYSTEFTGFDWSSNGWIDDGLVINNGAKAIIKYNPCSLAAYTASFRFYVDTSIDESELLISCVSTGDSPTGFIIYPEKVEMYDQGSVISDYWLSGETKTVNSVSKPIIHEVTLVSYPSSLENIYAGMMVIYMDGNIKFMLQRTGTLGINDKYITITATNSTLHLYNVSCFLRALSFTEVLSLNCFNLTDDDEISEYVAKNNIFGNTSTTAINDDYRDNITPDTLPSGSTLMIITPYTEDGTTYLDPTPWKTMNAYPGDTSDSGYKSYRHLIGSVQYYVKTNDGALSTQDKHVRNFYAKTATISCQGTSSMSYPSKNYRIYFDKKSTAAASSYGEKNGKSTMYLGLAPSDSLSALTAESKAAYSLFSSKYGDSYTSAPVTRFCLKSDYAESSGTHNTGFARLANLALTTSSNIIDKSGITIYKLNDGTTNLTSNLPPLDYKGSYAYDIRPNIDGRPIYLFWKDKDDKYYYAGKYNMNNDKANEAVFGFTGISNYHNNEVVLNEISNLETLFGITSVADKTYFETVHEENNPTECWEFSANTYTGDWQSSYPYPGTFAYPYTPDSTYPGYSSNTALFNSVKNSDPFTLTLTDGTPRWINNVWEPRFPNMDISKLEDSGVYGTGLQQPYLLKSLYKWVYKHNVTLYSSTADKLKAAQEFATNLHMYFNVNYLIKYYVLTKLFACADLRVKNCMLAFYCDPAAKNNDGSTTGTSDCPMGHMRGYYIFYDNDTILGLSNSGKITHDWNVTESIYPGYGEHGIWETLEYCYNYSQGTTSNQYTNVKNLGNLISIAYSELRAKIDNSTINEYFNTDLCDTYSDSAINIDAEIKYLKPKKLIDTSFEGGLGSISEPNELANMHGNRKTHRNRWLNKRMLWFDDLFGSNTYSDYGFEFKTKNTQSVSEGFGTITLKSGINDWKFYETYPAGTIVDKTSTLSKNESYTFTLSGSTTNSDWLGFYGLYGVKSINFSNFNWAKTISNTDETSYINYIESLSTGGKALPYLEEFILSEYDSENDYLIMDTPLHELINPELMPNLKTLKLCNAIPSGSTSFTAFDLSSLNKLEILDTRNTSANIILPNSSSLKELDMDNPTYLTIENKTNLTTINIGMNGFTSSYRSDGTASLIVNDSSSEALTYALNVIKNTNTTVSIHIGSSTSYYKLSDSLMQALINIVDNNLYKDSNENRRVSITGYITYTNSSVLTATVQSNLQAAFKESDSKRLIIDTSGSAGATLAVTSLSDAITLKEGETITFQTNKVLDSADNWSWSLKSAGGLDTSRVNVVSLSDTLLTLQAVKSNTNDSWSDTLVITCFTGSGDNKQTATNDTILVLFTKISSLTLTANKSVVNTGDSVTFTLTTDSSSTKSYLLNETEITWNTEASNVGTFTGLNYVYNGTNDIKVKATLDFSTNPVTSTTVTLYYDEEIYAGTLSDLETNGTTSEYYWIAEAFRYYGNTGSTAYGDNISSITGNVSVSTIKNNFNGDIMSYFSGLSSNSNLSSSPVPAIENNLIPLKYFNISGQFTMPTTLKISNISLPEGITYLKWSDVYTDQNNSVYTGYLTVTLPTTLLGTNISINTDNSLSALLFDLSNCTKITKVYNNSLSSSSFGTNGDFSISLSHSLSGLNVGTKSLFILPNTITLFGNYSSTESTSYPNAMFNVSDVTISNTTTLAGCYLLPAFESNINLGYIYGYRLSNNPASSSLTKERIINTYYSFPYLNNIPEGAKELQLANIKSIGTRSFVCYNGYDGDTLTSVQFGTGVTNFGYQCFLYGNYTIKSSETETINGISFLKFANVNTIGENAFAYMTVTLAIEFGDALTSLGAYAFGQANVDYDIYLNTSNSWAGLTTFDATGFGISGKTNLYLSTDAYSKIKTHANWETVLGYLQHVYTVDGETITTIK